MSFQHCETGWQKLRQPEALATRPQRRTPRTKNAIRNALKIRIPGPKSAVRLISVIASSNLAVAWEFGLRDAGFVPSMVSPSWLRLGILYSSPIRRDQ